MRAAASRKLILVQSLSMALAVAAHAGELEIKPRLTLREIYTDNLGLEGNAKFDDWVTAVTPGLVITGEGRRGRLSLDARADGYYYHHAELNDMDHTAVRRQVNLRGQLEVIEDWLNIDVGANSGERFANVRGSVGMDNLNPTGNLTEFRNYQASANLRHSFSKAVEVDLQHRRGRNTYERDLESEFGTIGDSDSENSLISLRSGSDFRRFIWSLTGSEYVTDFSRGQTGDSVRRNGVANVAWRINDEWSLLARGGEEDNQLQTTGNRPYRNGSYSAAGVGWQPNRTLRFDVMAGDSYEDLQLNWTPSQRVSVNLGYRDMDVGLLAGPTWRASISHRNRYWQTFLRHSEEVISYQQLVLDGREIFQLTGPDGKPLFDPVTGAPVLAVRDLFSLADGEIRRERDEVGFDWLGRRSRFGCVVYQELRQRVLVRTAGEDVTGASCNFTLTLQAHSRLSLRLRQDDREFLSDQREDRLTTGSLGWNVDLSPNTTTGIELSRFERSSSVAAASYEENRVQASMTLRF